MIFQQVICFIFSVFLLLQPIQAYTTTYQSTEQSVVNSQGKDFIITTSNLPSTLTDVSIVRVRISAQTIYGFFPTFSLVSPSGKVVNLYNGGLLRPLHLTNVFFRDDANEFAGQQVPYDINEEPLEAQLDVEPLTTPYPILPLERLNSFNGENPNGEWKLVAKSSEIYPSGYFTVLSWDLIISDLCDENPCVNNGMCLPDAHQCDCMASFFGRLCEKEEGFDYDGNYIIGNQDHHALIGNDYFESSVQVPDVPIVGSVQIKVSVVLHHPFVSGLVMTLVNPSGENVTLIQNSGGFEWNVYLGTEFNDDASKTADTAYFTPGVTYSPLRPVDGSLNSLASSSIGGTWYLIVENQMFEQTGTLYKWSISISGVVACPPENYFSTFYPVTSPASVSLGTCLSGLYGSTQRECILVDQVAVWSNSISGSCQSCPYNSYSLYGSQSVLDCVCLSGFYMSQNNECIPVSCSEEEVNGVTFPSTPVGETYSGCPQGFTGSIERTCGSDENDPSVAQWLEPIGSCIPNCPIDSGFPETLPGKTIYLNNCDVGQYGFKSRSCFSSGSWDSIVNSCSSCPSGFSSPSGSVTLSSCVDVNECLNNNGGCSSNSICTNTVGSRICQCFPGYSGDGITCTPDSKTFIANQFNPILRTLFYASPTDISGKNNHLSIGNGIYSSFYQRGSDSNQAVRLNDLSTGIVTAKTITLNNHFSFEVVFNLQTMGTSYQLFAMAPTSSSVIPLTITGNNLGQIIVMNPKSVFKSNSLMKLGRTYQLTGSIRNGQITLWLNFEKVGTANINIAAESNYQVSFGKGLNGYIDEVALYDAGVFNTNIASLVTPYACNNVCPTGKVCYNSPTGFSCI